MSVPRRRKPSALMFIAIAVVLMLGVEFLLGGDRPYYHDADDSAAPPPLVFAVGHESILTQNTAMTNVPPEVAAEDPAIDQARSDVLDSSYGPKIFIAQPPEPALRAEPLWRKNAVAAPDVPEGFNRVVIIIDDLGVDVRRSREILALGAPLTAAFLPYAKNVDEMIDVARTSGHEIMLHMPMETSASTQDLGPIALRKDMPPADFDAMLDAAFTAVGDGIVGLNNHMGSGLTQDRAAMERLMTRLYDKGLLFVDSRTIATSVAADVAADHNVPFAVRDVFLDHDPDYESVVTALNRLESVANRQGVAIAIGHPKDGTIRALQEWLPTLADKKLVVVPVSAVVQHKGESIAISTEDTVASND